MFYNQEKNQSIKIEPEVAGMIELADKCFKNSYDKHIQGLERKNSKRREMKTIKKNQMKILQLSNTVPELKNSLMGVVR